MAAAPVAGPGNRGPDGSWRGAGSRCHRGSPGTGEHAASNKSSLKCSFLSQASSVQSGARKAGT